MAVANCNEMNEVLHDGPRWHPQSSVYSDNTETEDIYLRLALEQEIERRFQSSATSNATRWPRELNDEPKPNVLRSVTSVQDEISPPVTELTNGTLLLPKWRQYLTFCLLYILTLLVVSATIAFAFLSSSLHPFNVFPSPQQTIVALNVASNASVFLIGEVLTSACEMLRWTLAANPAGLGMASFLALGRATGLLGVMSLVISKQGGVGHQKWCGQRYISLFCGAFI